MMPQPLHDKELASPASRSVTSFTQVENVSEDLPKQATQRDNRVDAEKNTRTYDQENIEAGLSTAPNRGHVLSPAAPVTVTETHRIHTCGSSTKIPFQLITGVQKPDISNEQVHKTHINAGTSRGDSFPERNSDMRYFKASKSAVGALGTSDKVPAGSVTENTTEEDQLKWGQGEGIDIDDLLSHFGKTVSKDDTEETVFDNKIVDNDIDKLHSQERYISPNVSADRMEDVGGMDANDGLPLWTPWTKNSSGVTGGLSVKDTSYSNEEHLSTSSVPFSGLHPTPSRGGGVNLLRPASLSAVGHAMTTADYAPSDAQPAIQVGLVAATKNDRNKSMHDAEKWDTGADFSLNHGAREITNEDRIILGLYDGWPYKSSDVNTGLPPMTEESWRELGTKQTNRRFASDGPSEVDTGRVTAENPSASTSPLLSIPANVSSLRNLELDEPFKLFDPPEPKPMQQEEAAFDMVDASGHNSARLSAIPCHAANSKTGTHSVVDTATHLTGVPEMYDTASLMKDTTKDMPADFGLQKWTGDGSVEQDTKYAKLVSSDSERPESSVESRDVSFMLWTACYPDDPDKARELEASTGVPGIRVYPVDVFFHATSNPQVLDEVDASHNMENSKTEMEAQVSPRRLSNE